MADAAFGMQLRESRKAAALSLRQLAVRVGYDHSYLSQVERGQRPGSADLARLCDRELGTGSHLASTYEQVQGRAVPAAQRAGSVRTTAQIDSTARPTDTHPKGVAALHTLYRISVTLLTQHAEREGRGARPGTAREPSNCAASCDQAKCGAVAPILLDRGGFVAQW